MQFRAVIKRSGGWWIGWLVDLPGVNAQERTREELIQSLKIGAEGAKRVARQGSYTICWQGRTYVATPLSLTS